MSLRDLATGCRADHSTIAVGQYDIPRNAGVVNINLPANPSRYDVFQCGQDPGTLVARNDGTPFAASMLGCGDTSRSGLEVYKWGILFTRVSAAASTGSGRHCVVSVTFSTG